MLLSWSIQSWSLEVGLVRHCYSLYNKFFGRVSHYRYVSRWLSYFFFLEAKPFFHASSWVIVIWITCLIWWCRCATYICNTYAWLIRGCFYCSSLQLQRLTWTLSYTRAHLVLGVSLSSCLPDVKMLPVPNASVKCWTSPCPAGFISDGCWVRLWYIRRVAVFGISPALLLGLTGSGSSVTKSLSLLT